MSDDARLRTATGLSAAWDGEAIKRVRASDGITVLPGRRVAMHLMAQPDVASMWLTDPMLIDQGLMSRVLATAPEPASGTRMWHEASPESETAMRRYGACLLEILERPMPLAPGARNELHPRTLPLAPGARKTWIRFADHVESRLVAGGELDPIRGLANKLPEHAARFAAVLTLVRDIGAGGYAGRHRARRALCGRGPAAGRREPHQRRADGGAAAARLAARFMVASGGVAAGHL
jgi:hypothetical protein